MVHDVSLTHPSLHLEELEREPRPKLDEFDSRLISIRLFLPPLDCHRRKSDVRGLVAACLRVGGRVTRPGRPYPSRDVVGNVFHSTQIGQGPRSRCGRNFGGSGGGGEHDPFDRPGDSSRRRADGVMAHLHELVLLVVLPGTGITDEVEEHDPATIPGDAHLRHVHGRKHVLERQPHELDVGSPAPAAGPATLLLLPKVVRHDHRRDPEGPAPPAKRPPQARPHISRQTERLHLETHRRSRRQSTQAHRHACTGLSVREQVGHAQTGVEFAGVIGQISRAQVGRRAEVQGCVRAEELTGVLHQARHLRLHFIFSAAIRSVPAAVAGF
mmetsp:Transcript_3217/g.6669  ORF Transcript_3217/g.6669 Transcript_3217/m.6669 type:complete len:327 (+) Transcript_3217:404-1384(+)